MPAVVAPVLAFLRSPLGRRVMVGLGLVALVLAIHHAGYSSGVKHERAADAARLAKAQDVIARREVKAVAISDTAKADLAKNQVEIRYRTKTLVEKVPAYVTAQADDQCILPVGFVRLHDAAAAGSPSLPPAARGSLEAPSGVDLSSALSTVIANYGLAYDWRAEALTWRAWYAQQAGAWTKP